MPVHKKWVPVGQVGTAQYPHIGPSGGILGSILAPRAVSFSRGAPHLLSPRRFCGGAAFPYGAFAEQIPSLTRLRFPGLPLAGSWPAGPGFSQGGARWVCSVLYRAALGLGPNGAEGAC